MAPLPSSLFLIPRNMPSSLMQILARKQSDGEKPYQGTSDRKHHHTHRALWFCTKEIAAPLLERLFRALRTCGCQGVGLRKMAERSRGGETAQTLQHLLSGWLLMPTAGSVSRSKRAEKILLHFNKSRSKGPCGLRGGCGAQGSPLCQPNPKPVPLTGVENNTLPKRMKKPVGHLLCVCYLIHSSPQPHHIDAILVPILQIKPRLGDGL